MTAHDSEASAPTADPRLAALAAMIVSHSAIARTFLDRGASRSAQMTRAIAILTLCEREPDRASSEEAGEILHALTAELTKRQHLTPATLHPEAASSPALRSDARPRAHTAHGGLLFLLHIVSALEVPRLVRHDEALASRSLCWVLHRLALDLALVSSGDPVALAFAGLPPTAPAPAELEPPASDAERAALTSLRSIIVASLRARLRADASEDADALLARTISRRAEIICDAAWIEARFALADATIDVRRAGLDLDPDWLPWLGVVVRFTYE
jgi:hypothetical protein